MQEYKRQAQPVSMVDTSYSNVQEYKNKAQVSKGRSLISEMYEVEKPMQSFRQSHTNYSEVQEYKRQAHLGSKGHTTATISKNTNVANNYMVNKRSKQITSANFPSNHKIHNMGNILKNMILERLNKGEIVEGYEPCY